MLMGLLMGSAAMAPALAAPPCDRRAPEVPDAIAVPKGNKVHFHGFAVGVQIYTWNGTSWGSSVPEATLFDRDGDIVAIHYAGPTWESESGSKVVGAVVQPTAIVDPDSIPWLLLRAVSTQGPGVFAKTTYVQRVNTTGGKAPARSGDYVGETVRVPYTADYYFFRSMRHS